MNTLRVEQFRTYTLLLILLGISLTFFFMIRTLLSAVFLAVMLAGLSHPVYHRVVRWTRGRTSLSAFICMGLVLLICVVPLSVVMMLLANEAFLFYHWVDEQWGSFTSDVNGWLDKVRIHPFFGRYNWLEFAQRIEWQDKIGDIAKTVSRFLYQSIRGLSRSAFRVFLVLGVMLFTMYYLFKDGEAYLSRIVYLVPMSRSHTDRLVSRFFSMIRATVKGTMVVGLIQGLIGGLTLWVFGVGKPVLWGVIMVVLSIIPVAGAGLVWGPAGIIRILTGHIFSGVAILAVGVAVISTIDNVLRPRLVGQDTTMHPLFIFLGTLGGISLFGIVGFLVGPIVAALFVTVWDIYGMEFKEQLETSHLEREYGIQAEPSKGGDSGSATEPEADEKGSAENSDIAEPEEESQNQQGR